LEYKNLKQTFLTLGLVRVLTVLSNFLITGLLLRILDVDSYGVYTAMFSLLSWMFLFDIGISKGMRNHLTKSLVDNDLILAKKIISTSYITTFVVTSFFLLLIFFFTKDADIASYLNISKYSNVEIYSIFIVFVLIMLCKLFLGTIDQILYAHHKSSLNSINSLIINLLFALALVISLKLSLNNIFYISIF
jgi:O-antigen/teichoic acid export membrane protein